MPKNRQKTRANAKKGKEELLNRKNAFGCKDLTPANAVLMLKGKETIIYK